jgi:hypothetical protein
MKNMNGVMEHWRVGELECGQVSDNSGATAVRACVRTANIAALVCRKLRRSGSSALPTLVGLTCRSAQFTANPRSEVRHRATEESDQIVAPASWSAAVHCRFVAVSHFQRVSKSARGLAQSKTSRRQEALDSLDRSHSIAPALHHSNPDKNLCGSKTNDNLDQGN